jgi:hypothetical protein
MVKSAAAKATTRLTKAKYPWCLGCNQRVEALTVQPTPGRAGTVTVEYRCHGQNVSQEMPAAQLAGAQGLAAYTAFNAYTSGLMLGASPDKAIKKKGKAR